MKNKMVFDGISYEFQFIKNVYQKKGFGIENDVEYDLYYFVLNGKIKNNIKIQMMKSSCYGKNYGHNWVLIFYKGKEFGYKEYKFNHFIDDINCNISFNEFSEIIKRMKTYKIIK